MTELTTPVHLELAKKFAAAALPVGAVWQGNIHVASLREALDAGYMVAGPKGRDNLRESELDAHLRRLSAEDGEANLVDPSELPTVAELIAGGRVGTYKVHNSAPVIL